MHGSPPCIINLPKETLLLKYVQGIAELCLIIYKCTFKNVKSTTCI